MLKPLDAALDSTDRAQVMAAAWEAFAVAERVADDAAFDDDGDELQALIAAQASAAGRSLLPLPGSGHPVDVPPLSPGAEGLAPYVELMRHVQATLERAAAEPGTDEGGRAAVREAAGKAATAAGALLATRER
ncbi:hypothetical protein V9L24_36985 [Streptomyces sp. CCNWLW230]|uniref:hypothetical protein n=1 Tax=Streptomyces sp. CCNWLW238 TaxID=3127466 RepID=UPI0030771F6E